MWKSSLKERFFRLVALWFIIVTGGMFLFTIHKVYIEVENFSLQRAKQHLVNVRDIQKKQVIQYIRNIHEQALQLSQDKSLARAVIEFSEIVAEMETLPRSESKQQLIIGYYRNQFAKEYFRKNYKKVVDLSGNLLDLSPYTEQLQYDYLLQQIHLFPENISGYEGSYSSAYDQAHQKYHDILFQNTISGKLQNLYLIDPKTSKIVYSAHKTIDFATSLSFGPYANSHLALAYSKAMKGTSNKTYFTDFEPYLPSYDETSLFVSVQIVDAQYEVIGVLVLQVALEELNKLMTFEGKWLDRGLEKTGETYLINESLNFISESRVFLEDPVAYLSYLSFDNENKEIVEMIESKQTSIGLQKVHTIASAQALDKNKGVEVIEGYLGKKRVSAYDFIEFPDFVWAIIAEIDTREQVQLFVILQKTLAYQLTNFWVMILVASGLFSMLYMLNLSRKFIFIQEFAKNIAKGERKQKFPFKVDGVTGELQASFLHMQTELLKQEVALRQKEEFNNTILKTVVNAIVVIDSQGIIMNFNQAAETIFGYKRTEAIGRNISMLMPAPYSLRHNGYIKRYLETGEQHVIGNIREVLALRKNGEEFPALLNISQMKFHGEIYFTGVILDITEQRTAEKKDKEKSLFISSVSHEFRTPLNAIIHFSNFGLEDLTMHEVDEAKKNFEKIKESSTRLLLLVNNILDFSKMESANEDLVLQNVQLVSIVDSVEKELSSLLTLHKLRVAVYNQVEDKIHCDVHKMHQVLINILSNAIKHSPHGTTITITIKPCHVMVTHVTSIQGVQMTISDQGPGVKEDDLVKIFNDFTQSSSGLNKGGTGLGLSLCKKIVEAHNGKIWAGNGKQEGLIITIQLPIEHDQG